MDHKIVIFTPEELEALASLYSGVTILDFTEDELNTLEIQSNLAKCQESR